MKASITIGEKVHGDDRLLPQLDLTGQDGDLPVEIEISKERQVMYVHVNGQTVLRISRAQFKLT